MPLGPYEQIIHDKLINKYWGLYTGIVKSIDDPEKLGRLSVSCPSITGNHEPLPFLAWPIPPFSGANGNYGFFALPEVGDMVFVMFVDGNDDEPTWMPGPWKAGSPPKHAVEELDTVDLGVKGTKNIPETQYQGKYGKNRVLQTTSGHMLEFDDTEGGERVQLYHKKGSHVEILPDGTINIVSVGNNNIYVGGKKTENIQGDDTSIIYGNKTEEIRGNLKQTIKGDVDTFYLGDKNYEVGKFAVESKGNINLDATGGFLFTCQATEDHTIGGQHKLKVVRDELHHVLESASWIISNSLNTLATTAIHPYNPLENTLLIHALNGRSTYLTTDGTGILNGSYIDMSYEPAKMMLYAGTPGGSVNFSAHALAGQLTASVGSGLILDGFGALTQLHSLVNLLVSAVSNIVVKAPGIQLGSELAYEQAILGTIFTTLYNVHTHSTAVGVSSPPTPPMIPEDVLSKVVKISKDPLGP